MDVNYIYPRPPLPPGGYRDATTNEQLMRIRLITTSVPFDHDPLPTFDMSLTSPIAELRARIRDGHRQRPPIERQRLTYGEDVLTDDMRVCELSEPLSDEPDTWYRNVLLEIVSDAAATGPDSGPLHSQGSERLPHSSTESPWPVIYIGETVNKFKYKWSLPQISYAKLRFCRKL
ncbi:hypothetical protein PMZ80_006124 [Knufia obscura]|uniref:Ubiquitin-like domain-containing protein n=1 Tax=Knufia obscura TaxID=1635080 RepID=A0ABR0RPJ9_9EURO|nr:hypothetical protein PMZ80_006124 [Knufia obscura]